MTYFAPFIDAAGLHIPSYIDIRDDMIAQAKTIYGQDMYLGIDSQDYQYISAIALKISDTLQSVQAAYNSRSPSTAMGAALASVVKINGIRPFAATYSTCPVILSGDPATMISSGIVSDGTNNWDLPAVVNLDATGSATVTAICETVGAVTAQPGTINKIVTPTQGWKSVTNAVPAVAGRAAERDSELRGRQAKSTQLPSQSLLSGTLAGVVAVPGVSRCEVYENDTSQVDANGLPPHSITVVVEGGDDIAIAQQIKARKGVGGYTNGTTEIKLLEANGDYQIIRFYRPTYRPIFIAFDICPLAGYSSATATAIQKAAASYLNGLKIGDDLTVSALWGAALSVMPNLSSPIFAIRDVRVGITANALEHKDIVIAFNEVTQGNPANVVTNPVS